MVQAGRWDAMVVVGRVARSHGRRGQVIVNTETDFPEARFRAGNTLYASFQEQAVEFRITTARFQSGRPVLGFAGVTTIDDASRLVGAELRVPEATLHPLPAGAFYEHVLVGCKAITVAGASVGTVTAVQRGGGANCLLVHNHEGEVDVPLVDSICVRIDTASRTVVIDPPDGLLELNRSA